MCMCTCVCAHMCENVHMLARGGGVKSEAGKQLDVSVYQLRLSESSAIRMCVIFH